MRTAVRALIFALIAVSLLALLGLIAAPAAIRGAVKPRLRLGAVATGETRTLGIVLGRALHPLEPLEAIDSLTRFTRLDMQMAMPPESAELDLRQYDGRAIVVQGREAGGWVYAAQVVAVASPWQTALIRWGWWAR